MSNEPQNRAEEDGDWQRVVAGLRTGEPRAVQEFLDRYGRLMHVLADQHLSTKLRQRLGPEDVVQSVCRTFFRRARAGEFQIADADALWRLLCAITVTKVRQQARFHSRAKRGIGREVAMDAPAGGDSSVGISRFGADDGPSPDEAAEFSDQFRLLVESLDEEERQLVAMKLDELTNDQIAEKLGCSERTVRRILKNVQARLEEVLEAQARGE